MILYNETFTFAPTENFSALLKPQEMYNFRYLSTHLTTSWLKFKTLIEITTCKSEILGNGHFRVKFFVHTYKKSRIKGQQKNVNKKEMITAYIK